MILDHTCAQVLQERVLYHKHLKVVTRRTILPNLRMLGLRPVSAPSRIDMHHKVDDLNHLVCRCCNSLLLLYFL